MKKFLSDPFLQNPKVNSVEVVWFTNFQGQQHELCYGDRFEHKVTAISSRLERMREDHQSFVLEQKGDGSVYRAVGPREVWRHQATAAIPAGVTYPYRILSSDNDIQLTSNTFSLTALPEEGRKLKILLTSDHQLMPRVALNLQKAAEVAGRIDAVFYAGDAVMVPDRASEWFDDNRGSSFFACLQGQAQVPLGQNFSRGARIIQNSPIFPAVGNHEVMGRWSETRPLQDQFEDSYPRGAVLGASRQNLEKASYSWQTFHDIFSLPHDAQNGYYSVKFGDVFLIVLNAACMWRPPELDSPGPGKYHEPPSHLQQSETWGYGQHIFEPIERGSAQYNWLLVQLESEGFRQSIYRMVMIHHPLHTLGGNAVPPFTNPVQTITKEQDSTTVAVSYTYPKSDDYLIRDIEPLLENAGVQLVLQGHTHIWNRFVSSAGVHYLEASHVGNTYGASWQQPHPGIPEDNNSGGDPNGLSPIVPNIMPLRDDTGTALPFVANEQLTVFSIFDSLDGTVSSYYTKVADDDAATVLFDKFSLLPS